MKTSKILLLLSAIFCLASCSDDADYNVLDAQKVSEVEDFVDERDGKVYKCVKIGNQIWMAQNLAYYVPNGQLAGCYQRGETEMDMEKLESELGNQVELTMEVYYNLFNKHYAMGSGDCVDRAEDLADWDLYYHYYALYYGLYYGPIYEAYYGYYETPEESMEFLKETSPKFWSKFELKIKALTMTDEEIILARTQEHSDKFAGNFTEEEGYFYTLDGAKAAVPEGWRIPSDEDWKKLEATLGMSGDIDVMNEWRGINAGDYLKVDGGAKFNAIYAGCNAWVYNKDKNNYWINRDYSAYFWCSDERETTVTEEVEEGAEEGEEGEKTYVIREGIVRQVSIYSPKIWRGVTRLDGVCYSVRCVKDAY